MKTPDHLRAGERPADTITPHLDAVLSTLQVPTQRQRLEQLALRRLERLLHLSELDMSYPFLISEGDRATAESTLRQVRQLEDTLWGEAS